MSDSVDVTRGDQSYCDWCLGELSPGSIRESEHLGLHAEFAWSCGTCLQNGKYRTPPKEWDRPQKAWPWYSDAE